MRGMHKIISGVIGFSIISFWLFGAESLPDADELFKRANDPGNGKVFSALEEVTPGRVKNRVVQQILPDGTKLSRSERVDRDDNSHWMLVNGDGAYMIIGNTAIKTDEVTSDPQKEIDKMNKSEMDSKVYSEYDEQFQIFAWIALFFLLVDFFTMDRKNRIFKKVKLFS